MVSCSSLELGHPTRADALYVLQQPSGYGVDSKGTAMYSLLSGTVK